MVKHEKKINNRKIKIKVKNNKKKLSILVFLLIIILAILNFRYQLISKAVLTINPILIENINISVEKSELEVGESIEIKRDIYPTDYSKSDLKWEVSNPDILEIQNNKIIAKNVGKSKIYLKDGDITSNELEIECLVSISDVSIQNLISELNLGDIYKLETIITPENATYKDLEIESSDLNVLSVDSSGNLLANSIGSSTISIKDYKENILKSFEIKVKKIPVTSIEIDDKNVTLGKNQSYILNAKVLPLDATYTDIEWKSSDNSIVKISNRQLTALKVGTAKITAITDEGDKTDVCTITVRESNPINSKKFANGNYNIRTGASTDYKILATTTKYEEIEFLEDTNEGWKKVRNSKGIVGYSQIKKGYYLDEKPIEKDDLNVSVDDSTNIVTSYHITGVPYLNQISLGYLTGCEAVSATMLLKFKGYDVSVQNIVDNVKNGTKKHKKDDGVWYGANPFEEFVGNPSLGLGKGSYGVFAKPITKAMNIYANGKAKNISGVSENVLFNYVSNGNPVVVWCVKNAGDLKEGVKWKYEDGSGEFQELVGEHCAVLIGYDEDYVYLNDPSAGANVKQSKSKFISNWKKLFSQAIVIE